jgi:hypothetical protein
VAGVGGHAFGEIEGPLIRPPVPKADKGSPISRKRTHFTVVGCACIDRGFRGSVFDARRIDRPCDATFTAAASSMATARQMFGF